MRQWDQVSEEFARVSLAADEAPVGVERVRAHEGALRLAQADGSFAEEFVARTDLTQALYHVPRDPQNLVHFTWLRRSLEPEHGLDQEDRDAVLWRLKWAVDLVEDIPEVPLSTLVAAIDDVEEVFRADGYHLRPVHAARARLAQHTGDEQGAARELAAWLAEPRDSRSDCPACEHRDQSRVVAAEDPRRALELLGPVVEGELTCSDEPRSSLGDAAGLRLGLGDVEGAVDAFRRAWHLAQDDPKCSSTVAQCLRVLLRLGNADRAVDLLLPRLGWLDELHTPSARMWFAATAAHVLDRADVVGLAPTEVDGRPVTDVAADLRRTADGIAAAFDARYGSTVVSETLAAAHDDALVPTEPTLPPTRLPATEPPGRSRRGTATAPAPADVEQRADAVRTALESVDPGMEDQVGAWLRERDGVLPVETAAQWAAVSFLDRVSAQDAGPERHRDLLDGALDAARRAGDEAGVLRCEGELAILDVAEGTTRDTTTGELVRDDAARAGDARARDVARRLEEAGEPSEAAGMWRRVAWFGIPDDPAADIARAATAYGTAGLHRRRLLCEVETAMALAPTDAAAAAARLDATEPEVADVPVLRAMLLDVRSRLARAAGDGDAGLRPRARGPRRARAARPRPAPPPARAVRGARRALRLRRAREPGGRPRRGGDPAARPGAPRPRTALPRPRLRRDGPPGRGRRAARGRAARAARAHPRARRAGRLGARQRARGARAVARCAHGVRDGGHRVRGGGAAPRVRPRPVAGGHRRLGRGRRGGRGEPLRRRGRAGARRAAPSTCTSRRSAHGRRCGPTPRTSRPGSPTSTRRSPRACGSPREAGVGEDQFDGEVLEPHVLRQGAHLLARHGEVDAAVERLRAGGGSRRRRARARPACRVGRRAGRPRPARGGRAPAAPLDHRAARRGPRRPAGRRGRGAGPGPGPRRARRGGRGGLAAPRPGGLSRRGVRRRAAARRASPRPGRGRRAPAPSCRARGSSRPGRRGCRSRR